MQLHCTLSCPICSHRVTEIMPVDACQFSMTARAAGRCFARWPVIVARSARLGIRHVRLFRLRATTAASKIAATAR